MGIVTYIRRKLNVIAHRWLKVKRPGRKGKIVGVTLHSTRSGVRDGDDGPRTERWAANPANRAKDAQGNPLDWGSFQDIIIFEDGTQIECCDWDTEMPTWTAGGGAPGSGTWAMSDNYIQIELAQGQLDEPFTERCIDSAAQLVAVLSHRYGFPIVRTPYVTQLGAPPPGITTHDNCANGRYYGKSDPGPQFPWSAFLTSAQAYYDGPDEDGDDDMAEVTRAEFDALKGETEQRYKDDHGWLEKLNNTVAWQFNVTDLQAQIEVLRLIQGEQGGRIQKLEDELAAWRLHPVVLE